MVILEGGRCFSEHHDKLKMKVHERRGRKVNGLEFSATKRCKFYSLWGGQRYPEGRHGGDLGITCCLNASHCLAPLLLDT